MVTNGFTFLALLIFIAGVIVITERRYRGRFFDYLPAIVIIYLFIMILSSLGIWQKTADIESTSRAVKSAILPAMIFLMLLRCDIRKIVRLGPRILLAFFTASLSIAIGFIVTYALFRGRYEPGIWKAFAALCGSWMGGTGNMVAIQGALSVSDSQFGYALLMDSINYAVWVMLLLAMVPFSHRFNAWVRADTQSIDAIGVELMKEQQNKPNEMEFADITILLGIGLLISALAQTFSQYLPQNEFITPTTWTVIIATIAGILGALTTLAKLPGSDHLSSVMLYILVALIASQANFNELVEAPLYIVSGFFILGIHGLIMLLAARIFKLDLFTCAVASLANVGGIASAPILAAAYSEVFIPIGVLMAMMGYIVGTGGGLVVGKILSVM